MWCYYWCMLTFYEFTRCLLILSLCRHVLRCHRNFNDKVKHLTGPTKVKLLLKVWSYKYILQLYCKNTCMEMNFHNSLICFNCMLDHGIIGAIQIFTFLEGLTSWWIEVPWICSQTPWIWHQGPRLGDRKDWTSNTFIVSQVDIMWKQNDYWQWCSRINSCLLVNTFSLSQRDTK